MTGDQVPGTDRVCFSMDDYDNPACGRRAIEGGRWTDNQYKVTCSSCLEALGHPDYVLPDQIEPEPFEPREITPSTGELASEVMNDQAIVELVSHSLWLADSLVYTAAMRAAKISDGHGRQDLLKKLAGIGLSLNRSRDHLSKMYRSVCGDPEVFG